MEKTPISKSKFPNLRKNESLQSCQFNSENEESPCTQEGGEMVDVVWDWNSPQAKQKSKRKQKRSLLFHSSPKTTLKRHTSNNSIQDIEKLKQEIQSLKDDIAIPENEDCLRLSPLQEEEFKNPYDNELHTSKEIDFFDESVDRELLLFSQRIENEVMEVMSDNNIPSTSSHSNINKILESNIPSKIKQEVDISIQQINNKTGKCESMFPISAVNINLKTHNTNLVCSSKPKDIAFPIHESKGKVEFHRTESFEILNEYPLELSQKELEEIERKRREALAKRELKRKQESITSPSKCSYEEIEQKRLQAVAKREAKRQQEIIERKRQEALKRLEINRKKNAKLVKSSLTNRLN